MKINKNGCMKVNVIINIINMQIKMQKCEFDGENETDGKISEYQ